MPGGSSMVYAAEPTLVPSNSARRGAVHELPLFPATVPVICGGLVLQFKFIVRVKVPAVVFGICSLALPATSKLPLRL